jgi:hypothetical protein
MEADVLVLGGGRMLGEAWMSAVPVGLNEAAGFGAPILQEVGITDPPEMYPAVAFVSA